MVACKEVRQPITLIMTSETGKRLYIYLITALASVVLSVYRVLSEDIINNDGILYIHVAKAYLDGGILAAVEVFNWPFYGVLIGLTDMVFGLGLETSAHMLNAVFLSIACVMFVRIYEEVSGSEGRAWVAAILVLSLPILNVYREMIIRGHGFWAFMLVALYCFIAYCKAPTHGKAINWQLALTGAILFRVEGVVFLMLAPLYFLFKSGGLRQSMLHMIRLTSLLLLALIIASVVLLAFGNPVAQYDIGLPVLFTYLWPGTLVNSLNNEAAILYERFWQLSSISEARLILVAGMLALVCVKVAKNIGLPFLIAGLFGYSRRWIKLNEESKVVVFFVVISLLIISGLALNRFFMSSRYTVMTILFVSLITFQYADYFLRFAVERRLSKWLAIFSFAVLALFLDAIITTGAGKVNIKTAGKWVQNEIQENARIACNESRLVYYTSDRCELIVVGEVGKGIVPHDLAKEGYTHLLVWVGRKDSDLKSEIQDDTLILIREFLNKKGDAVALYRISQG